MVDLYFVCSKLKQYYILIMKSEKIIHYHIN